MPTLVAELMPEAAGAAMGFQKSSEQLGIFVEPRLAGATIGALGLNAAMVGAGAVMVVGTCSSSSGSRSPRSRENA